MESAYAETKKSAEKLKMEIQKLQAKNKEMTDCLRKVRTELKSRKYVFIGPEEKMDMDGEETLPLNIPTVGKLKNFQYGEKSVKVGLKLINESFPVKTGSCRKNVIDHSFEPEFTCLSLKLTLFLIF